MFNSVKPPIQPHSLVRVIDLSYCELKIKNVGDDITATRVFLLTTFKFLDFLDFLVNGLWEELKSIQCFKT